MCFFAQPLCEAGYYSRRAFIQENYGTQISTTGAYEWPVGELKSDFELLAPPNGSIRHYYAVFNYRKFIIFKCEASSPELCFRQITLPVSQTWHYFPVKKVVIHIIA